MTLREHLDQFYRQYNIPENGGVDDKTFEVPLPHLTLKLPNYPWRKRMLYIHDLEHVLNRQDTTWNGEMFIASWEIATGFYQNFPIIVFPLWTMGWGIWRHPKTVFTAFRNGFLSGAGYSVGAYSVSLFFYSLLLCLQFSSLCCFIEKWYVIIR